MADRKFERRSIPHGDRMISAQVITCAVDGCGVEYALPDVGRSAMPPDAVSAKARREGWKVGRGPSRDRCPEHAGRHRNQGENNEMPSIAETASRSLPERTRQVTDTHAIDKSGLVTMLPSGGMLVDDPQAPLRVMDREEKRILFGELDAAYQDAEHGYKPGNSDKTVADALGVPIVWVRQLREDMFGPAEGDKTIKELAALLARQIALDTSINEAKDLMASLLKEAQSISIRLTDLKTKKG